MRSVTVADIIVRVRRACSAAGDTDFLPDAEVLGYINEEWPDVYALYVKAYPEMFRTEATVTSTGVAAYTLPSDYFETVGVDWQRDARTFCALRRLQEAERNRFSGTTSSPSRAYRVLKNELVLYPTPTTGQVYRHIYIPTAPVLGLLDSIDGVLGHEKMLVYAIAIRVLATKDEVDFSQTVQLFEAAKVRVEEEAAMRVAESITSVPPFDLDDDADLGGFRWSPP